jgi:hypothetical protein
MHFTYFYSAVTERKAVTESKFELWLLAIIVCMQTEKKRKERTVLFTDALNC